MPPRRTPCAAHVVGLALLLASALWRADAVKDSSDGSDRACAKGVELQRAGDRHAALAAYKNCVSSNANDPVMLHNIGIAMIDLMEYQEAVKLLESAVALHPLLAPSYAGLGQVHERMQRPCDAVAYHHRAIAVAHAHGQNADPFRSLLIGALQRCPEVLPTTVPNADGAHAEGSPADVLAQAVPQLAPPIDWKLWLELGTIALHAQRWRQATRAFRTCIRLGGAGHHRQADDCHFGAAICAAQSGDHLSAAHLFEAAAAPWRASQRQSLALMGAFVNRAKAASWQDEWARAVRGADAQDTQDTQDRPGENTTQATSVDYTKWRQRLIRHLSTMSLPNSKPHTPNPKPQAPSPKP
jgi:tetratricopeptide (TPR) repeat protein